MRPQGLMMAQGRLLAGPVLLIAMLAGCHGGSSSGLVPGASQNLANSASAKTGATASFSIFVPAASAGVATPLSVAVTLTQVNGATPFLKPVAFTANLTSKTSGCTAMAGGALSCTIKVPASIGTDTFTVATFTGLNGSGQKIASSQTTASVASDAAKPLCTPKPPVGISAS